LDQLEGARDTLHDLWGRFEWSNLVNNNITLQQLPQAIQTRISAAVGEEHYGEIRTQPLSSLGAEDQQAIRYQLGWFHQNETTRQLLLNVISELWVDYLTRVEALRVSIGLEAYAQRDPLVQYKGRASEMFQQLLADIRIGVISRLFTLRPRSKDAIEGRAVDGAPAGNAAAEGVPAGAPTSGSSSGASGGGKKKKRKRH
jgi:preprotein translocase subunit SecA